MRPLHLLALALVCLCHAAGVPEELTTALAKFHTEGPFGWAFTQTSSDGKETRVESYDPSQAPPFRWNLVSKNKKAPSQGDLQEYQQNKIIRTSALNAPRLENQLDLESCEVKASSAQLLSCSFKLKPGEQNDQAYQNLSVLLTLDRPTRTITLVEITSIQPFNPVFGVRIERSRTLLTYSLPEADHPSLLQSADISVKGRAFWIKSMDQTLSIRWSEHRFAGHRGK